MARLLAVDPQCPEPTVLAEALAVLRRGGVVAYPTDTVYGLAVDAMRPDALARLYTVKGRPESKALPGDYWRAAAARCCGRHGSCYGEASHSSLLALPFDLVVAATSTCPCHFIG